MARSYDLEDGSDEYVTSHHRPKWSDNFQLSSDIDRSSEDRVALMVQGPLLLEDEFTLNSIRIYKKLFNNENLKIILSTWEGEDPRTIEQMRDLDVDVVLSKKPTNNGLANINYQLVSSASGIEQAKRFGADYVIKTRTDQRIYAPNVAEYLVNLLKKFPPEGREQRSRVGTFSLNSFKFWPYRLSDMFIFGSTAEVERYFNIDLVDDLEFFKENGRYSGLDKKFKLPEIALATNYLESIGETVDWSLNGSWRCLAKHFIVVDKESLDLYWPKYQKEKEYRYVRYDHLHTDYELSFKEWFNIYSGSVKKIAPEAALDKYFGEAI